ncbi:hypothetical protein HK405_009561 [Cladochytrium tenue]|nr:hypothetical protein HK405_009561 [Cladochytrium tenue]
MTKAGTTAVAAMAALTALVAVGVPAPVAATFDFPEPVSVASSSRAIHTDKALVEFPAGSSCDAKATVEAHLSSLGLGFRERYFINTDLFCGYSFALEDSSVSAYDAVSDISGAVDTFRVISRERPKVVSASAATDDVSTPMHNLTGVTAARAAGYTGEGIKVAFIDTGVYYLHPALGGGFGPGFKVAFGYDLVGDGYFSGNLTVVPDDDPLDNCSTESHGTHVAGIIAADATAITESGFVPAFPFTGVAPSATLGAYRVFGCEADSTETDVITAAIYMAANDGANIISLSLGGGPAYNDESDAIAAARVGAHGHFVLGANGNDGAAGIFANGDPGDSAGGFGIASFDNYEEPLPSLFLGDTAYAYSLGTLNGSFNYPQTLDIFVNNANAPADGVVDDGCTSVGAGAAGKTALLYWGSGCGSKGRCDNAAAAGAVACLIYSNTETIVSIYGSALIPSASTTNEFGLAYLASAGTVKITTDQSIFGILTGGTVSDFSSPGPDPELNIKPDLGGIGGSVYSTISKHAETAESYNEPYAVYSGTSMATPYVAGSLALLLQARGTSISFTEARAYLQNTAIVANIYDTALINSVVIQGAGLVNIYNAITAETLALPSLFALNDTANTGSSYTLSVTNLHSEDLTYYFSHSGAATVNEFIAGDDAMLMLVDTSFTDNYATVLFGSGGETTYSTVIPAKGTVTVAVKFEAPSSADPTLFPIYSGYINIANSKEDLTVTVPYAGMVGSWKEAPLLSVDSPEIYVDPSGFYDSSVNYLDTTPVTVNFTDDYIIVYPIFTTTTRLAIFEIANYTNGTTSSSSSSASYSSASASYGASSASPTYGASSKPCLVVSEGSTSVSYEAGTPTGSGTSPTKTPSAPSPAEPTAIGYIEGLGTFYGQFARNSYATEQSIVAPSSYAWTGTYVPDINAAEVLQLPAGDYILTLKALHHFVPVAEATEDDFQVITSSVVTVVY